jgi:hypothetical protein
MATTKKAVAMAEELVSELKQRTKLAVALSFDTDQNPLVQVGTGAPGAKGALIKVMPVDWPLAKDVLGLASPVYSPHKILVAFEAITVSNTGADTDPNTWEEKLLVLGAVLSKGTRVEVYESAAGDSPDADDMVPANLKAAFNPSVQYGMLSGQ